MYYRKLSITGFGPYEERQCFEFDSGLTLIIGSNGSGKSSIFDAIQWAMFGPSKSVRAGGDKMSVINTNSHKSVVELEMEFDNSGNVVITRTLTRGSKHTLSITIGGELVEGGINDAQAAINSLLTGLEHDSFTAVSMLMSSPSSVVNEFITGDPKRRRVILSDIVDPQHLYEHRHKEVKKKITEANRNHQTLIGDRRTLEGIVANKTAPQKPSEDTKKLQKQLDALTKNINEISRSSEGTSVVIAKRELKEKSDLLDKNLEKAQNTIAKDEAFIEKYTSKKQTLENRLDSLYERRDTVSEDLEYRKSELNTATYIRDLYAEVAKTYKREVDHVSKIITAQRAISSLWDNDEGYCAVCGGELDESAHQFHDNTLDKIDHLLESKSYLLDELEANRETVDSMQESINITSAEISALESSESLDTVIDDIENSLDDIEADLEDAKASIKKNKNYIDHVYNDEKQNIVNSLENLPVTDDTEELERLESKRDELVNKINNAKVQQSRYDAYKEDIADLNTRLSEAQKAIDESEDHLEKLQKIKEETSPAGKISEDIDAIAGMITEKANLMYTNLFDVERPGILIESYRETNSGDEEPTCTITMQSRSLSSYSHGEQSRAISAILLGLVQAVHEYSGQWYVPLWDEPTVTIDNSVTDVFFQRIGDLIDSNSQQAIIITRDDVHPKNAHIIDLVNQKK